MGTNSKMLTCHRGAYIYIDNSSFNWKGLEVCKEGRDMHRLATGRGEMERRKRGEMREINEKL